MSSDDATMMLHSAHIPSDMAAMHCITNRLSRAAHTVIPIDMRILSFMLPLCALLLLSSLSSSSLSPSSSSSSLLLGVSAGPLEDLLAEGTDMLSGAAARDAATRQLREGRKQGGRNLESCAPFDCSIPGYVKRAKEGYIPESNGCGSYGFKIHSKWHESCCDVHDKCYGTCNETRDECDKAFKKCMWKQCKRFDQKKRKKERDDCEGQA